MRCRSLPWTALGGKLGGRLSRVAAEEADVVHPVPGRVGLGIFNGLGHNFSPDDLPRLSGQGQGDGSDAAVEVQYRLLSRQPGKFQGHAVQPLCLGAVNLKEGGDGQAEGHPAERLLQPVPAPQGFVLGPQNHIGIPGVYIEDHAGQGGDSLAQAPDQLLSVGQFPPVGRDTAQSLAGLVGAHIFPAALSRWYSRQLHT